MSNKNNKKDSKNKKESPGALLRKARDARDFSIQHVASQLRLANEIIEALENNELEKLPAPIFVRGYIRSYAALTGVSGDQIIISYNEIIGEESAASLNTVRVNSVAAERDGKWKRFLPAIIFVMLALLVAIVWLSSETTSEPVVQAVDTNADADQIMPVENEGGLVLPAAQKIEPVEIKDDQVEIITENKDPVVMPAAEKKVIDQKQAVVSNEMDQLVFEFSADSWTDVSDANGSRLIFRMVRAGQKKSVSGQPPFKITLGDAHSVRLLRNDVVVDLAPYIRGKVAKFSLGKK